MNIEELDLSVGAYNCIKRAGINFVSDIKKLPDVELKNMHMMTKDRFLEIKEALEKYKDIKEENKFTVLYPECGDWEAWYLNGKLIAEGHSVSAENLLHAISDIFPNTIENIEISDEKAECGFTKYLDGMI